MSVATVIKPVFFFGAMSPYTWFAAQRIGTLIPTARAITFVAVRAESEPAVKDRLRATTERAVAQGVVGVPTVVVGHAASGATISSPAAAGAARSGA